MAQHYQKLHVHTAPALKGKFRDPGIYPSLALNGHVIETGDMAKDLLKPQTSPSLPAHFQAPALQLRSVPWRTQERSPKTWHPSLHLGPFLHSWITRAETMMRTTAREMTKARKLTKQENIAGKDKAVGAASPQDLGPCTHLPNNR